VRFRFSFFLNQLAHVLRVALLLGGDFFTGAVLASALTKLVLRFDEKANDKAASNVLRAEVPLLAPRIFTPRTHSPHSPC
jgi:hypothetical protein